VKEEVFSDSPSPRFAGSDSLFSPIPPFSDSPIHLLTGEQRGARMIKVLVVDDSPVVRGFLTHILETDPEIRVIGTARNGAEAVEAVEKQSPDLVTMDVHMPIMDGYEATRNIMETNPVPIVMVSGSVDFGEVSASFQALEAGALAIVSRPAGCGNPDHERNATELIRYVKAMAGVRLVRRWPRTLREAVPVPLPETAARREAPELKVVAIGASTGGPVVIQRILAALPRGFPAPVLIVQHMARGFIAGFVGWLAQSTGIAVKVAEHNEPSLPGAYVAPDGFDMGVEKDGRIILRKGDTNQGHCPSVAHLFRSVAEAYGEDAVGILLTGMGKDGAEELLLMKERGALTVAQDEESSIVYGMPGAARKLDAVTCLLPPDSIAELLKRLADKRGGAVESAARIRGYELSQSFIK
jgi:two-component system, chemotaxis family, protein-glutamate methylesterase/glutaminase